MLYIFYKSPDLNIAVLMAFTITTAKVKLDITLNMLSELCGFVIQKWNTSSNSYFLDSSKWKTLFNPLKPKVEIVEISIKKQGPGKKLPGRCRTAGN